MCKLEAAVAHIYHLLILYKYNANAICFINSFFWIAFPESILFSFSLKEWEWTWLVKSMWHMY